MLIYLIPNLTTSSRQYICDSQATIDAAPEIVKALCIIGNVTDADIKLTENQQAWLNKQATLFTCNLQTTVEGGVAWAVVDLTTEPENVDREYFVLDPTTGLYNGAIGLDAAKALLAQTQQTYLVFTRMNAYTTLTSWGKNT